MDIIIQSRFFKHLLKLFDRSAPTEPPIKQLINKPLCPHNIPELMPLERVTPEDVGVSSAYIADFIKELSDEKSLDIHGVMIMKDGKLICDAEFGAYRSEFWHSEHSLGKSVTAMAIGMLIDDGKLSLDDSAVKILEKKVPPLSLITHKAITVRHLLTMTSGIAFAESGAVVEDNWLRAYFESRIKTEPGKVFNYNSMNTYILSCIVKKVSGVTLREFLKPRLFEPLGISVMHWETAADGNEIGGWGLYMRREDVAKLGRLYLDGGVYNGKRIISEKWIKEATSRLISAPETAGDFDYGYQTWSGRKTDSFLFNGMFGQDMIAFPKTKTAVILNGGVEQIFQQSVYYDIIQKYFGGDFAQTAPLKKDRKAEKQLKQVLEGISSVKSKKRGLFSAKRIFAPEFLKNAVGSTYSVKLGEGGITRTESIAGTANLGVLPLMEQVLRNSYTKGITSFAFHENGGVYILEVKEGSDTLRLPISLGETVYTVLRMSDTEYHTAVTSESAYDENGRGVLKLRISFPEISSSRFIKIYFDGGILDVKMSEIPGMGLASYAANAVSDALKDKKTVAGIISKIDPDLIYYKLKNTVEPEFRLYRD